MQQVPLVKLNDNNKIPRLGLGTWQLTGRKCIEAVRIAINEIGYRHIDTAEIYGNHREIAEAISDFKREELFITSKLWNTDHSYEDVFKACDRALEELNIEYLDLYLIHWPNKEVPIKETWKAMEELVKSDKVKSIGISNFTIHHIEDLLETAEILPVTNQVEFHPYLYQRELQEFCERHNIVITAYSPLARGKIIGDPILKEIGEKYNKTETQVALRWLVQHNCIVIPKASSREHLERNYNIFDFELNNEDMERIDSLNRNERLVMPSFHEFDY
ncbi:MAG: aldo/keto reductase [Candidatus Diapherotrites archaeon]|nr:aldo/keto reductase [Candidatus Diapherotrites archaeon]